ncbi:MAG: hypothetical protein EOO73_31615 [Myxococcales bacterium]|nr:MAG: hypothetical protein EOO73_31615 [Myxococcales bacterium]
MVVDSASEVVDKLRELPDIAALSGLVTRVSLASAVLRRPDLASKFHAPAAESLATLQAAGISAEQAQTPFGNPLTALEHGPEGPAERQLLGALLAIGVSKGLPEGEGGRDALAADLVWLATHTTIDALAFLDAALQEGASGMWEALAHVARDPEAIAPEFGRAEALIAAAAIAVSGSEVAHRARLHLSHAATDSGVRALASGAVTANAERLDGEMSLPPFGPVVTALLTVTLVLFALQVGRVVLRWVLAFKRPASISIGPNGLELNQRTELLGKVLRERSIVVPLGSLVRVTRETRYARVGMYVGLVALVVGSYFGMGLFVDAIRVPGGSASLFGLAVLMMVLGLALDFTFSNAADTVRGKCRMLVVPQRGRVFCLGSLDPARADAMLSTIAEAARA